MSMDDKDVNVSNNSNLRTQVAAAKKLTEWKHVFSCELREKAKQLAIQSGQPDLITLTHYQQAARTALRKLADAIENVEGLDARRKAA